jgi:type VI secretion system protein ImpA
MAKLCLKAERPDLAKPLLDELYALIEELQLERWESPTWLGEVIEALYQCLTCGDERLEDPDRALTLLRKLCTTDVTKAMTYKT